MKTLMIALFLTGAYFVLLSWMGMGLRQFVVAYPTASIVILLGLLYITLTSHLGAR